MEAAAFEEGGEGWGGDGREEVGVEEGRWQTSPSEGGVGRQLGRLNCKPLLQLIH